MNRALASMVAIGAWLAAGCDQAPAPAARSDVPVTPPSAPAVAQAPPPGRDSLVLTTPDGYQVWFAEGRSALGDGHPCYEWSVEIRRDQTVTKVPLLFTNRPITPLPRGYVKAELMRACQVIAEYRVELATGRPTKLRDR